MGEACRVDNQAGLLCTTEEVGDVARQPQVAIGWTPDAERAGAVLHLEHAVDCFLYALLGASVGRGQHLARNGVDIEQWQRAADSLLGAAVWIAIQLGQQSGDVQVRHRPDLHVDARAAGDQILGEITRQRHLATVGFQCTDRHAADVTGWRTHVEGELALDRDAVRAGDVDGQRHRSDVVRLDLQLVGLLLTGLEVERKIGQRFIIARDCDFIVRIRTFDVVHVELQAGFVAKRQEARARYGERHRITDDHVS